jgi:hypothetical protein
MTAGSARLASVVAKIGLGTVAAVSAGSDGEGAFIVFGKIARHSAMAFRRGVI